MNKNKRRKPKIGDRIIVKHADDLFRGRMNKGEASGRIYHMYNKSGFRVKFDNGMKYIVNIDEEWEFEIDKPEKVLFT